MKVLISTSMGDITAELDEKSAPITVKNFMSYVKDKFYDGTIFHRVIPGFMIQGGGMDASMNEKKGTKDPIKNEAGLSGALQNKKGTLAMARTMVVDSATAQFFINTADNAFLDHNPRGGTQGFGYAVFGKVIAGMDVVEKIGKVKTGSKGFHQDVPTESVVIKSVTEVQ